MPCSATTLMVCTSLVQAGTLVVVQIGVKLMLRIHNENWVVKAGDMPRIA